MSAAILALGRRPSMPLEERLQQISQRHLLALAARYGHARACQAVEDARHSIETAGDLQLQSAPATRFGNQVPAAADDPSGALARKRVKTRHIGFLHPQRIALTAQLVRQLCGGANGDESATFEHPHSIAEMQRFLCVVCGEEHRAPLRLRYFTPQKLAKT